MIRSSVSALLILILTGCHSAGNTRTDAPDPIRVMSYNIRYNNPGDGINAWPNRKDHVAEMISARYEADVAGLQEALEGQINDLQQRLPDYAWFGVGRNDGKAAGEFTPIFYRKDRFELLGGDTFWLSESPTVPGSKSWDAAITRIATWVRLRDRASGREFLFLNTHFDHIGDTARVESARLIESRMAGLAGDLPFFITGDLNVPEKSPAYAIMTRSGFIRDARYRSESGHKGPTASFSNWEDLPSTPDSRIDYVFVRDGLRVLDHRIMDDRFDGRFPSDHVPVMATVQLP